MKRITYVNYYDNNSESSERKFIVSAKNKSDYIIESLNKNNIKVTILSASGVKGNNYAHSQTVNINSLCELKLFSSIGDGNLFRRVIDRNIIKLRLLWRLLLKENKSTTVLVYHSLAYMSIVNLAHKLKRFTLILEVEELYSDVLQNSKLKRRELDFITSAEKYIFPTELLESTVNIKKRPFAIAHGSYRVEKPLGNASFLDPKMVHCVYSGTFDVRKGGAAAAAAAAYLPSNYHVHIMGFGSSEDTKRMINIIDITSKKSKCKITYEGEKRGEEYIRYLQNCSVGLCTQDPEAAFNETSFPSKILSYLCNGLRVVSIRIPAIEKSRIGDLLYYYDIQSPENIANAILNIDFHKPYDSRNRIKELDEEFIRDVGTLVLE